MTTRTRTRSRAAGAAEVLWVLASPDPHSARTTCVLRAHGDEYETDVDGLGTTLRWGYRSREAALAGAMRMCQQLRHRGWTACETAPVIDRAGRE